MYDKGTCVGCGSNLKKGAKFCTVCGAKVPVAEPNVCTNPVCSRCKEQYEFRGEDIYCDQCGETTTLGEQVTANT